jgi:acetylornithine deacetylase/succinyl-diaminopimelate desuccinylase-like protein
MSGTRQCCYQTRLIDCEVEGIPALAYGPGWLSVAHGPDEFVSVKKPLECAEVYALTAARLLS